MTEIVVTPEDLGDFRERKRAARERLQALETRLLIELEEVELRRRPDRSFSDADRALRRSTLAALGSTRREMAELELASIRTVEDSELVRGLCTRIQAISADLSDDLDELGRAASHFGKAADVLEAVERVAAKLLEIAA